MSTEIPAYSPDESERDAWDEYRERIPADETLAEMSDGEILDLASLIPRLNERLPRKKLERQLSWLRDGGVPLHCDRCGNDWVYRGSKTVWAPCSGCHTSVKITSPEGRNQVVDGDD